MMIPAKPFIIGFYGESRSGKTTLVERITEQLTQEGHKIAVIKISNQKLSLDTKGKDTSRYGRAGAKLVVLSSEIETIYLVKNQLKSEQIIANIQQLGDFDFIFIEGANENNIAKIRLGGIKERENTIFTYDGDYEKLLEAGLIHTDLSPYNILIFGSPIFIDFSQAIPVKHQLAKDFLIRDLTNINNYFKKLKVKVVDKEELLEKFAKWLK